MALPESLPQLSSILYTTSGLRVRNRMSRQAVTQPFEKDPVCRKRKLSKSIESGDLDRSGSSSVLKTSEGLTVRIRRPPPSPNEAENSAELDDWTTLAAQVQEKLRRCIQKAAKCDHESGKKEVDLENAAKLAKSIDSLHRKLLGHARGVAPPERNFEASLPDNAGTGSDRSFGTVQLPAAEEEGVFSSLLQSGEVQIRKSIRIEKKRPKSSLQDQGDPSLVNFVKLVTPSIRD